MKTWYAAVCHKCGEGEQILVSNPQCTLAYLGEKGKEIQAFLTKHYGCSLELIWRDDQLDKIFNSGWIIRHDPNICRYFRPAADSPINLEKEGTPNA
jgi:hypothetical protein